MSDAKMGTIVPILPFRSPVSMADRNQLPTQ